MLTHEPVVVPLMNTLAKAQTVFWINRSRFRGWRHDSKILVIESDDWGCTRMADRLAFEFLVDRGYAVDRSALCLDMRESSEDVVALFEVLVSHPDRRGRAACITGNMIMANPDFEYIRQSNFTEYRCVTLSDEPPSTSDYESVINLLRAGMQGRMFIPQFHCREHVRWWKWLEALQTGSSEARLLFDLRISSLPDAVSRERLHFDGPIFVDQAELDRYGVRLERIVKEGVAAFRRVFGFTSLSTVAPNYTWSDKVEEIWKRCGIEYVQGSAVQLTGCARQRRGHFTGERGLSGLIYLVRNCNFEQNDGGEQRLSRCLTEIARAFRRKQPAILCSHRANYVGGISREFRDRNLRLLDRLLAEVRRRWPDVYFLSSPELGHMIANGIDHPEDAETSLLLHGTRRA